MELDWVGGDVCMMPKPMNAHRIGIVHVNAQKIERFRVWEMDGRHIFVFLWYETEILKLKWKVGAKMVKIVKRHAQIDLQQESFYSY